MNIAAQVPLGDFMRKRGGSTDPSKQPSEPFVLYSIPAFDIGKPEFVRGRDVGSPKKNVECGDVLLSRIIPHIRRSWIVGEHSEGNILASGEWIVFRSKKIAAPYLRHFLTSDVFHRQFMQTVAGVGGSLLRANPNYVAEITIPLPPLAEQRRIAAILDKADALRRKRKRALDLLRVTKDAFVAQILRTSRDKVDLLGNSLTFLTTGGRSWSQYYSDAGDRFIRSLDVQMNTISAEAPVFVVPPDNAEARRTRTETGDVLLTVTGSRIGRVTALPPGLAGSYISQHVAILRPDQGKVRTKFLAYFLSSERGQGQIQKWQYGQTKPGLNFQQIERFEIPSPFIEQQIEFEKRVDFIETLSAGQDDSRKDLDFLFSSLQHRAFSGQL